MSFLDSVRAVLGRTVDKRSLSSESVFGAFVPSMTTTAPGGVEVNGTTAMSVSAVWNAVNLIAGSGVASIPLKVYRDRPGGRDEAKDHYLYRLVHDEPNPHMTSFTFRETLMHHVLLWGNAYAEIEWDNAGRPIGLWPLSPKEMTVTVSGGVPLYRYNGVTLKAEDLLHIPGLGFDGVQGYSVLSMARQSLGLSIATERYGAAFFGNGAWPGLVASFPSALTDNARKNLRESLNAMHQGPSRAHGTMILEEGAKIDKVGIPPDDAQFLETRNFSVVEVARWFNVPPHKIKDMGRATWGNAEQMNVEFVTDCLRPWYVRIEQEMNRKLVSRAQRGDVCIEFVPEGLLRGDIATRFASYATARQWGFMSVNEIRDRENMNRLPPEIGDQYLAPGNMTPAEKLGEEPPPAAAPPPPPPAARAAIRGLLIDMAAKTARTEARLAQRASSSPEKLQSWAEKFYPSYAGDVGETFGPAVRAYCAAAGVAEVDLAGFLAGVSRRHAEAILSLPASSQQASQVERLVLEWEQRFPVELVDFLGGEHHG